MPTEPTLERYEMLQRMWRQIRRTEDEHQVQLCRELEQGFAEPIFHWAEGKPLEAILAETEMAPGDFVRNCKQLIDLLRQVEDVAEPATSALAAVGAPGGAARRRRLHRGLATMPGAVTSPFGTLAVIANPSDGDGRVRSALPALERALAGQRLDVPAVDGGAARRGVVAARRRRSTEAPGSWWRWASDGTVQDVVNGMFRDGSATVPEAVLGVVAASSAYDLVRSFGLPEDVEGAVRRLTGENTYPFDVMRITCQTREGTVIAVRGQPGAVGPRRQRSSSAANACRAGSASAADRSWDSGRATWAPRRHRLTIAHDMKSWEGEAFQVIVGNAQYGPGGPATLAQVVARRRRPGCAGLHRPQVRRVHA